MVLDPKIEEQVRGHIAQYRVQGYSDEKIKEALLKSSIDPLTVSQLMASSVQTKLSSPSYGRTMVAQAVVTQKPFYKRLWFLIPVGVVLLFLLLFVIFLLTQGGEDTEKVSDEEVVREVTLEESDLEEEVSVESSECGDAVCDEDEDCGLDCGCDSEDDCPEGYNCNDYECTEVSAEEAVSNISRSSGGGGGGGGSSSSGDSSSSGSSSSSTSSTCVDSDCGVYVCDTGANACYSSCDSTASGEECAEEYYCADAVCTAQVDLGELCSSDAACSSGVCSSDVCVECDEDSDTCNGYACDTDNTCLSSCSSDDDCENYSECDTDSSSDNYNQCIVCEDSDGGVDPYVTGTVITDEQNTDTCTQEGESMYYVEEYSCSSTEYDYDYTTYYCTACEDSSATCVNLEDLDGTNSYEDSDGGEYALIGGNVSGYRAYTLLSDASYYGTVLISSTLDTCKSDAVTLQEKIVRSDGSGMSTSYISCTDYGSTYSCVDGDEGDYCSGTCTSDSECDNSQVCDASSGVCTESPLTEEVAPYADVDTCVVDSDCTGTYEVCSSFVCYTAECSDGVDNDDDGGADYPNDSGCDSSRDDQEAEDAVSLAYAPEGEQGFFARIWSWFLGLFGVGS